MKSITIAHMNYRHFKYEGWLYTLAFLLALGLRLTKLGAMPLSDTEAQSALQALHIAQGLRPALSHHPFYILLTSALFFIFGGGTNFLARFIPAIVGSALVFVPLLFQERLKPRPSLILAFFLALDPGLVTLSREAASAIFAITFFLFAWGFWINNRAPLAGAFAALALLGGPFIWAGLLAFAITWAIRQGMEAMPSNKRESSEEQDIESESTQVSNIEYRSALIPFISTFLIAGSLLFIVPSGLGAAFTSLPAYFQGWGISSGVPPLRLLSSLLIYQPLALVLGIIAIGRGWMIGSRRIIPLSIWLLVTLLLAIFYPMHQVSDIAWALVPLYTLAALELARNLNIQPEERRDVLGVILLTVFILIFAWIDFAGLAWTPPPSQPATLRLWLLFGSLFLLFLSLTLAAAGWSARVARFGASLGIAVALGIFGLAGTFGAAGLRGLSFPEFWWPAPVPTQADLLDGTINTLSEWDLGNDDALPIVLVGINSPALEWTLRDHPLTNVTALDPTQSPPLVITTFEIDPRLASSYRGQDFIWRQTPAWETAVPAAWIRWIALREMPQNNETIILWAREDLFLDSPAQTTP